MRPPTFEETLAKHDAERRASASPDDALDRIVNDFLEVIWKTNIQVPPRKPKPAPSSVRTQALELVESIATRLQGADPTLSSDQALAKALSLPAGQFCAAVEREGALRGIPFADEDVAPVEPVLTRSDIEIEKRIDALLAKAEN